MMRLIQSIPTVGVYFIDSEGMKGKDDLQQNLNLALKRLKEGKQTLKHSLSYSYSDTLSPVVIMSILSNFSTEQLKSEEHLRNCHV